MARIQKGAVRLLNGLAIALLVLGSVLFTGHEVFAVELNRCAVVGGEARPRRFRVADRQSSALNARVDGGGSRWLKWSHSRHVGGRFH